MGMRSGTLIRRKQLARILRDLRRRSGLTIEDLAPRLDFSPSKLSRIENAHHGLDDQGYVPLEAEASAVREYTVNYLPGLLQTADYARALFETSLHAGSRAVRENDVEVRMIRQQRLTDPENPLTLVAVIEEAAVRRGIGGPEGVSAQPAHALGASGPPTVT